MQLEGKNVFSGSLNQYLKQLGLLLPKLPKSHNCSLVECLKFTHLLELAIVTIIRYHLVNYNHGLCFLECLQTITTTLISVRSKALGTHGKEVRQLQSCGLVSLRWNHMCLFVCFFTWRNRLEGKGYHVRSHATFFSFFHSP